MVYIDPYNLGEHPRMLRRRVYRTLRGMAVAGNPPRVMLIMQHRPSADWERIWANLHECLATEALNWYVVIQYILPTNERLHEIRLVHSPLCGHCGEPERVQHRVTACGKGARIWLWIKRRIAWISLLTRPICHRSGQRDPSSSYGHLSDIGRCYGHWPKWCGT
jgi:hypothetical protein